MMAFVRLASLLGLAMALVGCAQVPAAGGRHPVVVNPFCGPTAGPSSSPPAAPYDFGTCYPDGI
ncbi:MAG: hypothetical protein P4L71_11105 [Acetobacteraceae bacterium]|nr:hypothetical protein [Acetobacteraceae bacterium]